MSIKKITLSFLILNLVYFGKSYAQKDVPQNSNFGFQQTPQKNIEIVPDDMNDDPFFNPKVKKSKLKPEYEISLQAGAFLPTTDKESFTSYYQSKPNYYAKFSISKLIWAADVGFAFGMQGAYFTNSQTDPSPDINDSSKSFTRNYYNINAQGLAGIRLRFPSFLYLQPGIFVASGLSHYYEKNIASPDTIATSPSYESTTNTVNAEYGVNLDISLSAFTIQTEMDNNDLINEFLLRVSASNSISKHTDTLSTSGYIFQAGVVFLIN